MMRGRMGHVFVICLFLFGFLTLLIFTGNTTGNTTGNVKNRWYIRLCAFTLPVLLIIKELQRKHKRGMSRRILLYSIRKSATLATSMAVTVDIQGFEGVADYVASNVARFYWQH